MRARLIGGLPADLVGSLSGLTQGHFPVHAKARYADDLSAREATKRVKKGRNAALPVDGDASRRGVRIFAKAGSPVVAVQDGKIVRMGWTERLGRFVQLRDVYGNTYTYAHLKKLARAHPVPKRRTVTRADVRRELDLPRRDPAPRSPASAGQAGPAQAARSERHEGERRTRERRRLAGRRRPRRDRGQGAPLRPPRPPARLPRRRRGAAPAERHRPQRLDHLQLLLHRALRPQAQGRRAQAPQARVEGHRRHDPRPDRHGRHEDRPAHALRDPPGRPRGPAHRPQADPRRLEAARVHRDLPRGRQEPVLRPRRRQPVDRPDPADEQGGAAAPRAHQREHRDLRVRAPRRARRRDRPPRPGRARVPRRQRPQADGHLAALRPRLLHGVGQRLRTTRPATPSTSPRSTASRSSATRARARSPTSRCGGCSRSRAR